MHVALVVMPFAAADRPSLAAGLLKASLAESGIACDVKHFNLLFWKMLGHEAYRWFAQSASSVAMAGEWVFSQALWGSRVSTWEGYQRDVLDVPVWGMRVEDRPRVLHAAATALSFMNVAFASTDWSRYEVVGFTSTFQQTLASLALAARIRKAHPKVVLVAGGANLEGPMGRPYLEAFGFLDYVSTGEAEVAFPELLTRLAAGRTDPPPGFLHRRGRRILDGGPRTSFMDLDALPIPDFDDYFRVLRANDHSRRITPWLQVEASRGCFWGRVSQCTFCGLNGDALAYRTKGWRRVVEETDALERRHGPIPLQFSDNVLAMRAFHDLIPFWVSRHDAVPKFFEVRSNLKRSQLRLLKAAGVAAFQAGIESLADGTLKLMRKGVTSAQGLALLRWAAETGIHSSWNLLFGFPGESRDDERVTLGLIRKMVHLRPPDGCAPIRMDRFSPNFEKFAEMGFTRVAPVPAYRHLLPMNEGQLRRAAYYFEYDHPDRRGALGRGLPLMEEVVRWRELVTCGRNGRLEVLPHVAGGYVLLDERAGYERSAERLSAAEEALLLACDGPISRKRALEAAVRAIPAGDPDALEKVLARLVERDLVVEAGESLVTLALLPEGFIRNGLARAS